MSLKKGICVGVTLLLTTILGVQAHSQSACPVPQSPRNVNPQPWPGVYNGTPPDRKESFVTDVVGAATIKYKGQTLKRCDQHYHVPVENTQGCHGEKTGTLPPPGQVPPPDQWIEIHTVYAPEIDPDPKCADGLDHDLKCCKGEPVVVRGFSARVTLNGTPVPAATPIIPADGRLLAEWTGSNTGPDKPEERGCKPIKAEWSFLLNCEIKVSQSQLRVFPKAHGARPVQTGDKLSQNLTLVSGPPPSGSCKQVSAPHPIANNEQAKTTCTTVCAPPAEWGGQWVTTVDAGGDKASKCGCCTVFSKTPGH